MEFHSWRTVGFYVCIFSALGMMGAYITKNLIDGKYKAAAIQACIMGLYIVSVRLGKSLQASKEQDRVDILNFKQEKNTESRTELNDQPEFNDSEKIQLPEELSIANQAWIEGRSQEPSATR